MRIFSEIAVNQSMRLIARGLAAGQLRTVAAGLENVPAQGPALIVARHYHHLYDGLLFFAALRRPFHMVVSLDWVKNRRTKFFFSSMTRIARWPVLLRNGGMAVAREHNTLFFPVTDVLRYQRQCFRETVDLLVEGRIVVIFPEAYPNIDPHYTPKTRPDEFLPFKPGFARIVARAEGRLSAPVPIVPAGIRYECGKPWTGELRLGEPVHRGACPTQASLIDRVETDVKQLSALIDAPKNAARPSRDQVSANLCNRPKR
jgi:putative membrane protein